MLVRCRPHHHHKKGHHQTRHEIRLPNNFPIEALGPVRRRFTIGNDGGIMGPMVREARNHPLQQKVAGNNHCLSWLYFKWCQTTCIGHGRLPDIPEKITDNDLDMTQAPFIHPTTTIAKSNNAFCECRRNSIQIRQHRYKRALPAAGMSPPHTPSHDSKAGKVPTTIC